MKLFFIGNWKMNMLCREAEQFIGQFREVYELDGQAEVGIAPPFTALAATHKALSAMPELLLGVQNVHWLENGAHTGEISAPMVREHGAKFVILGHSERRHIYRETDEEVAKRARAAIDHELRACVCVGETKDQFERGETQKVVTDQLRKSLGQLTKADVSRLVLCYEPVWAIGTGLAATAEQAAQIHGVIKNELQSIFGKNEGGSVRILYGGSVSPSNIASFTACPDVHGAIVGGASLDPEKFALLIQNGVKGKKG